MQRMPQSIWHEPEGDVRSPPLEISLGITKDVCRRIFQLGTPTQARFELPSPSGQVLSKLLGLTSGQDVSPPRQDRAWSQGTFGSPHLVLLAPLAWELGTTASSIRLQTPEVLASRPAPP